MTCLSTNSVKSGSGSSSIDVSKISSLGKFCLYMTFPRIFFYTHRMSPNPDTGYTSRSQYILVYYKCLRNGCEEIVKEDLIHVTEDLSHDQDTVQAFLEASVEHLKQKGVEINKIIQFSDHAGSQYKSKTVFYTLSKYDIPVTNLFLL